MGARQFSLLSSDSWRSDAGGWVLRGGVAVFFVLAGLEKFPTGPTTEWPAIFAQIGLGQWFRYFTGVVEVVGGILYLLPPTCPIGAALLACTMVGPTIVHNVVRHSVDASPKPPLLLDAIAALAFQSPVNNSLDTPRPVHERPHVLAQHFPVGAECRRKSRGLVWGHTAIRHWP